MTKDEYLAKAAAYYDALQSLNDDTTLSFYEYEKQFDQQWTALGREVLQGNLGEEADSRKKMFVKTFFRKKKTQFTWDGLF